MCKFCNVTKQFLLYVFFIFLKSLRSSVSEGIRAVDERMSKQEDIRKKKVGCTCVHGSTLELTALLRMWSDLFLLVPLQRGSVGCLLIFRHQCSARFARGRARAGAQVFSLLG